MSNFIKLRIGLEGDAEVKGKLAGIEQSMGRLGQAATAVAQGIGLGLGSTLLTKLSAIPDVLNQAVREGVAFNATLESSRLGIAAVLKQFDTAGRFANFNDALTAAGAAIDLLKEKAKTSPATFEQLVGGFQGLSGAFAAAGMNIREQVDTVVLMSQALSGLGIRSDQLLQESRAIVTGNITPDAQAAKILGITAADIATAKQAGDLYGFLQQKLGAFAEAGAEGAKTLNVQLSNLEDSLTQLKGTATAEFFDSLKEGIAGVNSALADESASRWAAGLGRALAAPVQGARGLGELFGEFQKQVGGNPIFQALDAAFTPMRKLSDLAFGGVREAFQGAAGEQRSAQLQAETQRLQGALRGAKDEQSQRRAIKDLDDAILARRGELARADGDTAAQLQHHIDTLQRVLDARETLAGSAKDEAAAQREIAQDAQAAAQALASVASARERLDSAAFQADSPEGQLERLRDQREGISGAVGASLQNLGLGAMHGTASHEAIGAAVQGANAPDALKARVIEQLATLAEIDSSMSELAYKIAEADIERENKTAAIAAKKEQALAAAREDFDILKAQVAGNDELAGKLAMEKSIREQIAALRASGIDDDELNAQIRKNAELEREKQTREQIEKDKDRDAKAAAARAQIDLAQAEAGGGNRARRTAARDAAEAQKFAELRGVLGEDEARSEAARFADAQERKAMRAEGRIGGRARRSEFDRMGGFSNLGDVGLGGLRTGTAASDDFLSLKRQAVTHPDLDPGRGPGGADAGAGDGGLDAAAAKTGTAADAMRTAAGSLDQLSATVTSAAGAMTAAGGAIAALDAAVKNLETIVSGLKAAQGR